MPGDLEKKTKDVQTESKAAADVASNLQKLMSSLKKATDSASKAQKELSGESDD